MYVCENQCSNRMPPFFCSRISFACMRVLVVSAERTESANFLFLCVFKICNNCLVVSNCLNVLFKTFGWVFYGYGGGGERGDG